MLLILSTLIAELLGFCIQVTAVEKKKTEVGIEKDQPLYEKKENQKKPRKMYLVDLIEALQRHPKGENNLKSAKMDTNTKGIQDREKQE